MVDESDKQEYLQAKSLLELSEYESAATILENLIEDKTSTFEVYGSWTELMLEQSKLARQRIHIVEKIESRINNVINDSSKPRSYEYLTRATCKYLRADHGLSLLREKHFVDNADKSTMYMLNSAINIEKILESKPEFKPLKGIFEDCMADCDSAIELEEEHPQSHLLKSYCLKRLGLKDESQACLSRAMQCGYEVKIEGKKYAVENLDDIKSSSTKALNYVGQLIEYMAYPISILMVMPNVSTLHWTGTLPVLLGWSLAMWLLSNTFNIGFILVFVLLVSLSPANKDKRYAEILITKLKKFMMFSTFTIFVSSFLSFFLTSQMFASQNLYLGSLEDALFASLIVCITVGSIKNTITFFKIYTTKNIKLKVTEK